MKRTALAALVLLAAVSCRREAVPFQTVSLVATIEPDAEATKAAVSASAYEWTSPSAEHPIEADIWFSTTEHTFPGNGTNTPGSDVIEVHKTITYNSNSYTFPDISETETLMSYPSTAKLYCIGFSPRGKWSWNTTSGKAESVAGLVDGSTDILYAPEISGTGTAKMTTQTFKHALTWIKVRVRAFTTDASATWGKLQKIEIETNDKATYDVKSNSMVFSQSESAPVKITAYEDSTGEDIPSTSKQVGSVFVAPVYGTSEESPASLKFKVTTEEWADGKEVTVNLIDENGNYGIGNTAGKLYVVTLSFKSLNIIEASATLTPWEDEAYTLIGTEQ